MKNRISLSLLLFSFLGFSQNIFVPYKVGSLFGISDEKGNIKITPSFDYINISPDQNNYFLAYKNGKSSCIYNDKVIIADKNYFGYYPANDLIVAVEKSSKITNSYYSNDNEQSQLYTNTGKLIFNDYFMYIGIHEVLNEPITSNVLIYLKDMNGKYTLVMYNKKKQKITQTFFKEATDVTVHFNQIVVNERFFYEYISKDNVKKRIGLSYNGAAFSIVSEETLPNSNNEYDLEDNAIMVVDTDDSYLTKRNIDDNASRIEVITIEKPYGVTTKKQFKWISNWVVSNRTSLVFENSKYGIKKYNSNELLIPIEYDAIYSCDFLGHFLNGYILKKEDTYGLYVSGLKVNGKSILIPNRFKNIPLIDQFNYGKEDFHIIGLYDDEGKFLYYANNEGFIYAK